MLNIFAYYVVVYRTSFTIDRCIDAILVSLRACHSRVILCWTLWAFRRVCGCGTLLPLASSPGHSHWLPLKHANHRRRRYWAYPTSKSSMKFHCHIYRCYFLTIQWSIEVYSILRESKKGS